MHLRYTNRDGADVRILLGPDPVIIGRVPECDVPLADDRVSRHHCEIRAWAEVHAIRDLKSHNGTLVNGKPVEIAILKAGDRIDVGSTTIFVDGDTEDSYRGILSEIVKNIEHDKH